MIARRVLALFAALALLPACHDDDDDGGGGSSGSGSRGTGVALAASLSGNQEAPPVLTFGDGAATVFISEDRDRVQLSLTFSSLTGVTMAHIHVGRLGADGPIIFDLSTTTFVSPLDVTLTAGDFRPQPGVASFADAVNAIERGDAYVNVHTLAYPDGEIRGQIGPASFRAALSGSSVLPAVPSPGSGVATVALNADQAQLTYSLSVTGLTTLPTAARIHVASAGRNGPAIFDLATTMFTGALNGTLSAADLRPQPLVDVLTFANAVDALLSGNAYVLVSTGSFPSGEVRGQLVHGGPAVPTAPVPPDSTMTSAFPPPPPPSPTPIVVVIPPVVDPLEMPVSTSLPPVSSPSVPPSSNLAAPATTPAFAPVTNPTLPPVSSPSVAGSSNLTAPATTPLFAPVTNPTIPPVSSPSVAGTTNLTTPATTPIFGPAINPTFTPFTIPVVPVTTTPILPPAISPSGTSP